MTAQNRHHTSEPLPAPHRHRYAFPTPTVGSLYITGLCDCGAESRGLAFESNEYAEARSFRGKRRKA